MDSIKEESDEKDIDMDSSCDSVWNTLETEITVVNSTATNEHPDTTVKASKNARLTKKTAIKRSRTIPLITPSTPIVPIINNESIECDKSLSNKEVPSDHPKLGHVKKPKMCTVCG